MGKLTRLPRAYAAKRRITQHERRANTKRNLRSSALTEIARNGIEGTSIDQITEAAGVSRGAFYSNYKSKWEILLEIHRERSATEAAAWRRVIESDCDLESILTALESRFIAWTKEPEWGLFSVELQLHAKRHPAFAVEYNKYYKEIIDATCRLNEQLFAKAGKVAPFDIKDIAIAFHNLTIGMCINSYPEHQAGASSMYMRLKRALIALAKPIKTKHSESN